MPPVSSERSLEPDETAWSGAERLAWIDTVLTSGLDFLRQQLDEVWAIRGRAVTFSAFIAAASAVLITATLGDNVRPTAFYVWAGCGTIAFLLVIYCLFRVVRPKAAFSTTLRPDLLLPWMLGPGAEKDLEAAKLQLAGREIPDMIRDNEKSLKVVRRDYNLLLVLGFVTVAFWIVVAWIFA